MPAARHSHPLTRDHTLRARVVRRHASARAVAVVCLYNDVMMASQYEALTRELETPEAGAAGLADLAEARSP